MAARTFDPQPVYVNIVADAFEWAVDHYIPEDGITCFLGEPGAGKTYAAVDFACCKATGLNCWGQRVGRPRKVIYIAADAGGGIIARINAWIIAHADALEAAGIELVEDAQGRKSLPNLLVWPKPVNLHGNPPLGSAAVIAAAKDIRELGLSCDVLVVDTLFHSSAGANLAKPEELLPALGELQNLMDALGAKTCVLVHHTTKDGETYFGTVVFEATLAAMILFNVTADELTKEVSCMRIREDEKFKPFSIKMQKVTMETKPDQFGRTERTMLSVTPGTAPAKPKQNKVEKSLDGMCLVLSLLLRNKATAAEWEKGMADWMAKSGKKPWAPSTFFERLKLLKEQGRIIGGGGQDEPYSVVLTDDRIQPEEGSGESTPDLSQKHSDSDLLQRDRSSRSAFWSSEALRNHSDYENRSGSSQGSEEGKGPTAEPLSKGAEALRQTAELFEKAKARAEASAKAPKPDAVKKTEP
jgi:hypothetical protein